MHATKCGELAKEIRLEAQLEERISKRLKKFNHYNILKIAEILEKSSHQKRELAERLKAQARLDDLCIYMVEIERKISKKGRRKIYSYWYASWREGNKVRNCYIGSPNDMNHQRALEKARILKAKSLGIDLNSLTHSGANILDEKNIMKIFYPLFVA
ncbi:Uncharacterised protein [uncultured archaeon]|nr:Uncharacterised protein [uncultured archaeon]